MILKGDELPTIKSDDEHKFIVALEMMLYDKCYKWGSGLEPMAQEDGS